MKTILFAFIVSFLFIVVSTAQAATTDRKMDFSIVRKGDKIGSHIIHVHKEGATTKVNITTRSEVKVLGIRAYHFEFDGEELWKDGKLVSMHTTTNDDGTKHTVSIKKKGKMLEVTADGMISQVSADTIPSSWWNSTTTSQDQLLDVLTGQMKKITVTKTNSEEVLVDKRSIKSDRYKIDGELSREVWYAKNGDLLRQTLEKKGSKVTYILK